MPAVSKPARANLTGWLQIAAIALLVLVALAVTLRLAAGDDAPRAAAAAPAGVPVEIVRPEARAHQAVLRLTGTVEAAAAVELAPQVGGRIIEVSPSVRPGARFEAGEVLFRIDPRDYEVALSAARARLADAESGLAEIEARSVLSRREFETVFPDREINPLAAREPQLAAARASVQAARADVDRAALDLERTSYALPFSGRIIDSRIEAGQQVFAGQSYGSAYALEGLEIEAPAAPSEIARLGGAEGRTARVRLEGSARVIEAQVVREGAILDPRSRLTLLYLAPSGDEPLRPGEFADIEIDAPPREPVYALPAAAVTGLDLAHRVAGGRIEEVRLDVLDREGDRIIAAPFDIGEGVIVSPLPDGAAGSEARIVEDRTGETP